MHYWSWEPPVRDWGLHGHSLSLSSLRNGGYEATVKLGKLYIFTVPSFSPIARNMLPMCTWWWNELETIFPRFMIVLMLFGGLLNCHRVTQWQLGSCSWGMWWGFNPSSPIARWDISVAMLSSACWPVVCVCVPWWTGTVNSSADTGGGGGGCGMSCDVTWTGTGTASSWPLGLDPTPTVRKWLLSSTWMSLRETVWTWRLLSMVGCWLRMLQSITQPFWLPEMRYPPRIWWGESGQVGGGEGEGEGEGERKRGRERRGRWKDKFSHYRNESTFRVSKATWKLSISIVAGRRSDLGNNSWKLHEVLIHVGLV